MKRAASGEDEERSLAEQRRPRGSERGSNREREASQPGRRCIR
jgi:hypothetical protein